MTQRSQHPHLDQPDRVLCRRLVARPAHPSRHDRHLVMAGECLIAAVQHRIPIVGLAHPGLGVVGNQHLRAAADIGEGPHVGGQPVLLALRPRRLGVDQVRTRQAGDKHLRLAGDAGVDHRQLHAGPINLESRAGAMRLAHPRRPRALLPGVEMLAELGVAPAFRMPAQIFQPQQPQCHAATAQLLFDHLPIRNWTAPIAYRGSGEQAALDLLLAQPLRYRPAQSCPRGTVEIFFYC